LKLTEYSTWDGVRSLVPRKVTHTNSASIGSIDIVSAIEDISIATDWCFEEAHHTIVVHLDGCLKQMEFEFARGPSGSAIPIRGDIWIIPASCRYAALAQGNSAKFVEFKVPTKTVNNVSLTSRVRHKDDFLFGAASRLSELLDMEDDLSRMATHAIADTVQLHLLGRYGHAPKRSRSSKLSSVEQRLISNAIWEQLGTELRLESLATLVNMDVRRFTGAFRQAYGLSPWQYIIRLRLEEAARLLCSSNWSITEIALSLGFSTPGHFATSFTKKFGLSPSRYRSIRG